MRTILFMFMIWGISPAYSQIMPKALPVQNTERCYTMKAIEEAIRNHPGIEEEWRKNGQRQYEKWLQRSMTSKGALADTITIPVVFHLVDEASRIAWITDRTIYDQLELMNRAFRGLKTERYRNVIPKEIYDRRGKIPVRFVLARRTPDGSLTSGIERRTNTTPGRVDIKSYATGGLDAWDTDKYLNIWVGTFSGGDNNLLGVATFPFTDTEGPQGVVVGTATLPVTVNVARSYYPPYSEGVTLIHEVGHYFYLYHTFGDLSYCNNQDFRIQSGWPLPAGAGPEGDDTPPQKFADPTKFGNPSMVFGTGCSTEPFGEMYGSFMNYYDDRAAFMFSEGHRKRVVGCIELYRAGLANSDGGEAPVAVSDAYVVSVTPYGSPERKTHAPNGTPLMVTVRNYGNTVLNSVNLVLAIDGSMARAQTYILNLAPGRDSSIHFGNLTAAAGNHLFTVYSTLPNGVADPFPANDTVQSFVNIMPAPVNAPYAENFDGATFPPAGWQLWNPNGDATWTRSATSGFDAPGSATMQFRNFSGSGQLDELVMPPIAMGSADSAILSFRRAYAAFNNNVSLWDGLEVYVSDDNGESFDLLYKKTGFALQTTASSQSAPFLAPPEKPENWLHDTLNLTPYLSGKPLLIKFRGVNARGNNLYLDDVSVKAIHVFDRDVQLVSISKVPEKVCGEMPTPEISFRNNGKQTVTSLNINYSINDGPPAMVTWSGTLGAGLTTYTLPRLSNLPAGTYELKIYSSMPNGMPDENPADDTLRTWFYVMGRAQLPVVESFENSFPSNGWVLMRNESGRSWEKTNVSASDGQASIVTRNFDWSMGGLPSNLASPIMSGAAGYDSVFISFDYAYAPGSNYPAMGAPEDTLVIAATTSCGDSFITLFKEAGERLVTVADPGSRKNTAFVPLEADWKSMRIYLSPIVGNSDFQIYVTSKGNHRNNLYVDNVRIYGVTVPQLLKDKGYLFYPSPFTNRLIIRNYEVPVDLKSIEIYSATGQLMWRHAYQGDAMTEMSVNTSGWARGVYIVKMNFKSRTVTERVIKQ